MSSSFPRVRSVALLRCPMAASEEGAVVNISKDDADTPLFRPNGRSMCNILLFQRRKHVCCWWGAACLAVGVLACALLRSRSTDGRRRLPRFTSVIDDTKWESYLKMVYGDTFALPENETLDVDDFDFFYLDFLEASGLNIEEFSLSSSGCNTRTDVFQPDRTLRRNLKNVCWNRIDSRGYPHDPCVDAQGFVPTPSNTWVEVTHCAVRDWEELYWTYRSRGSGIWLNTGETVVYQDHDTSGWNIEKWRGLDSLQYIMPEWACAPMEMVFTNGRGAETCGGISGLREGGKAERPFTCNASHKCLQLPPRDTSLT